MLEMAIYNVVSYGATGNGSSDDTSAISSAIAACTTGTSAGIVYFPAGIYKITSPLTISLKTGCILRGEGNGASYIKNSNLANHAVIFTGCSYCGMESMAVYSDTSSGIPTNGWAVEITGSYDTHLRDVNIGYCSSGIGVISSSETILSQVLIRSPYGTWGVYYGGTSAAPCYGMAVEDLVIDMITPSSNINCILFQMDSYANSLTARRMALIHGGYGFLMTDNAAAGSSSWPQFAELFDVECDHNYYAGFWLSGGTAVYLSNGWVGSCITGNGIVISSGFAGDVSIVGTRVVGNSQFGILLYNGPTDIMVTATTICLNGQGAYNTYHGLLINNQHVIINGCRVGGLAGSLTQQAYGIFIQTSSSYYVITSNDTTGNLSGGILNAGTAPNNVSNNL
jgi:hypothetical protein